MHFIYSHKYNTISADDSSDMNFNFNHPPSPESYRVKAVDLKF